MDQVTKATIIGNIIGGSMALIGGIIGALITQWNIKRSDEKRVFENAKVKFHEQLRVLYGNICDLVPEDTANYTDTTLPLIQPKLELIRSHSEIFRAAIPCRPCRNRKRFDSIISILYSDQECNNGKSRTIEKWSRKEFKNHFQKLLDFNI